MLRSIYQVHKEGQLGFEGFVRIVMDAKRSRYIYLFPMPAPKENQNEESSKRVPHVRKPFPVVRSEFLLAVENAYAKKQTVVEEGNSTNLLAVMNSDEEKNSQKRNYVRNKAILDSLTAADVMYAMLELDEWQRQITKAAVSAAVSEMLVRRLLSRYFEIGMDTEKACLQTYDKCGSSRTETPTTRKLGRPRDIVKTKHNEEKEGVNAKQFVPAIEIYLASRGNKWEGPAKEYRDFKDRFDIKQLSSLADGSLVIERYPDREFITSGQFRYWALKIKGAVQLQKHRVGERRVVLTHRALLGDARDYIGFPGHTYIIDATVADVYLVSAYDRTLLIGRPVIYIVIDAFSSLILGLHVTLEGPNFEQANIAVYRALSNKTTWLEWLGLNELQSAFPQGCRPTFLYADRAELHSKASREQAQIIRYALSLAAPYRADWKSLVERFFKILNESVIHWMPGAVRARAKERGERDVRLDAVLTLHEFTKILALECALWNQYKNMSKHISASMLQAGAEASPISFYQWGLENLHSTPYLFSQTEALEKFLPLLPASVSRRGIFVGGDRYTESWMKEHPSIVGSSFGIDVSAGVIRDPNNPLQAYCYLGGENIARPLTLNIPSIADQPYGYEDINDFNAFNKLNGQEWDLNADAARTATHRLQNDIVQDATAATKEAQGHAPKSKSERTKNIKKNRKDESSGSIGSDLQNESLPEQQSQRQPSAEDSLMAMISGEIDGWE